MREDDGRRRETLVPEPDEGGWVHRDSPFVCGDDGAAISRSRDDTMEGGWSQL